MQTKVIATLFLAAGALIVSAGCHPAATPPPGPAVPTQNPNAAPPAQGAQSALTNPNTPPAVKKYLQEHQSQINQNGSKPAGGQ